MADETGMQDIRGINLDKGVTGFALRSYVFKDRLCMVQTSSKWQERYYSETAGDLTSNELDPTEGIPRLATFPHDQSEWTLHQSWHKKHGAETRISHEDVISNDVDVIVRELQKIARKVVKSVDTNIWNTITEDQTPDLINSLPISAGHEWNSATESNRDPIQNLLDAKVEITNYDYDPEGAFLCLNPKDYANFLGNANVRNAGQFYTPDVTRRGEVGTIVGLRILVSNNVTPDKAAIVIGKLAATWKTLNALKTVQVKDPGIGVTIRSWEIGVCQLRNPKAVCLITNTDAEI